MKKMPYESPVLTIHMILCQSAITGSNSIVDGGSGGDSTETGWGVVF